MKEWEEYPEDLEWRVIPGFERYEINNYGDVWSNVSSRFLEPCIIKGNYLQVSLHLNSITYTKLVHRLVLEIFKCPCPLGMETRHLDGNPQNNHIDNLEWGTKEENSDDKIKHGTFQIGENNGKSYLTEKDVKSIRNLYDGKDYSIRKLAKIFNVCPMTISGIINYKTWKHI